MKQKIQTIIACSLLSMPSHMNAETVEGEETGTTVGIVCDAASWDFVMESANPLERCSAAEVANEEQVAEC